MLWARSLTRSTKPDASVARWASSEIEAFCSPTAERTVPKTGCTRLDDAHDPLDGRHRGAGAVAQARDAGADVVCRIAGLDREGFDLGRDDREAPPGSARASRLDGGVEGEEIRLPGDRGDRVDDPDDLLRGLGKLGNEPVGALAPS